MPATTCPTRQRCEDLGVPWWHAAHGYKLIIVELRTPAMPVGVGGGKERGGFHLN